MINLENKAKCSHQFCTYEIYENNKCIFHCEKTIQNGWITENSDKYSKINDKIEKFWQIFIEENTNLSTKSDIIIPFYHTKLVESGELVDIRNIEELKFRNCTFADDFNLLGNNKKHKLKNLIIVNAISLKWFFIRDLHLEYFSLLNISFQQNPSFQSLEIKNGAELMDLKSLNNSEISINLNNIESSYKEFEIWKINDNNIKLNFEGCKFDYLYIHEINCKNIKINYSNFNKLKIEETRTINLKFKNVDFNENSKILFERINCGNLILDKVSQESKYIQFNHIKINYKFMLRKIELHNSYFNELDISESEKIIDKSSFTDSKLSNILWGNISQIKAGRDFFRELKSVYDENHNYLEANNFYTIEMKKYKEELFKKEKNKLFNNFQDKLIFWLGEKISDFSQSWVLALLWIFILNFTLFNLQEISSSNFVIEKVSIFLMILISCWIIGRFIFELNEKSNLYIFQHIFILIGLIIFTIIFSNIENVLQFSHIQSYTDYQKFNKNSIFILWIIHKMMLSFLVYHFVISLKKQTRR
ncbi:hypothetical protein FE246_08160 [Aliarcobacter thereius]|uniref:Pentapeptide repeat-containing protein n=1 Tax=Aliarcobacter thereius TaxID=544718 RepID=A0A5R9GXV2_9BACT|nr:hypothetical protein [Aliarcobacter thereius]TLS71576.1 hypothetical protein FE246_08160 [Aliarcobacter thereius]